MASDPANISDTGISDPNGLATISDDGTVPKRRIKDAATFNGVAADLWYSDQAAALDRSVVDGQVDGLPPIDQGGLRADGMGNSANVNFLGSAGKEATALAAYYDLVNATENLIQCQIETGPPEKRIEKALTFAAEYTRLMRFDWPDFVPNMQYLAKFYIRHGVVIAYRPDSIDWRWKTSRIGDFQVQRRQNCSVEDMELAILRDFQNPDVVYSYIEDTETAKEAGWNIAATKKAIQNAVVPLYNSYGTNGIDPEMWERDAKENSLFWTQGKAKQVELRMGWIKEFDGTVTFVITTPDNDEEFLFEKNGRWDQMSDTIVLFTYGVGNGDLYSIRGLGWMLFGSEQLKNVLLCKMANSTMMSMGQVVKPANETAVEDFQTVTWGDITVIPANFDFQTIAWPNLAANGIPFLNMIGSMQTANTGTYTPTPSGGGSDVEKTKAQFEGEAAMQAVLSSAAISLFYQSLDRLDQMTVRALIKDPYPDVAPGGKERAAFIKRCMDRGLTMEDIQSVSCVRHVRAIGAGSEAVARAKAGSLLTKMQFLDPVAQRQALRMALIQDVGVDNVNSFLPATGERIPEDKKVAELESSLFLAGITPEVMPDEIPIVHIGEHLQFTDGTWSKIQQGELQPQVAIPQLGSAIQHIQQHIQLWQQRVGNESNSPDAQNLKQIKTKVQQQEAQLTKLIQNVQQQAQSQQEAEGKAQGKLSAEELDQQRKQLAFEAEEKRKQEAHVLNMQRIQAETENALLTKRALANSEIEHATARTNAHIHRDVTLTDAQIQEQARKTNQDLAINDLYTAQDLNAVDKEPETP